MKKPTQLRKHDDRMEGRKNRKAARKRMGGSALPSELRRYGMVTTDDDGLRNPRPLPAVRVLTTRRVGA